MEDPDNYGYLAASLARLTKMYHPSTIAFFLARIYEKEDSRHKYHTRSMFDVASKSIAEEAKRVKEASEISSMPSDRGWAWLEGKDSIDQKIVEARYLQPGQWYKLPLEEQLKAIREWGPRIFRKLKESEYFRLSHQVPIYCGEENEGLVPIEFEDIRRGDGFHVKGEPGGGWVALGNPRDGGIIDRPLLGNSLYGL